jgi:UDP-glucose 4-epimerase
MARILISGASGLLGMHTMMHMRAEHEIHALVRTKPNSPIPNIHYHICDFVNGYDDSGLPPIIDAVFHLAQSPFMREYPEKAREIRAVNADATTILLAYAKRAGARHFVLASTGGLYAPSSVPLSESSPIHIAPGALSYYFQTKHESEQILAAYSSHFHCITLRPFFMYGSGQARTMLIPRLMQNIQQGIPLTLQGEHGMECNPIHAEDAAIALASTLTLQASQCYNIAGPQTLNMRTMGTLIGEVLGVAPCFTQSEGERAYMVANIERMCADLSVPQISFKEGIARMNDEAALPLEKKYV